MPLSPGTRLGAYEILAAIGAGGMGEVYRARDARLGRDVAIKILPDVFVNDASRLARFEREARTLASLNHTNIAQIYGLEDRALVMELVEGEDLSALMARGPMPPADALPIARQVAQALEAAHELGVVHRDLKPANIKVRPDGTVKVLDFGLAKAVDPTGGSSSASPSHSPTMTSPATELGMILGTAAYMSPEQARGKPVDRRADVWAFGIVLYEMLSGRRAFEGSEVSDVLASVLKDTVPLERLPVDTPPAIRRLLRRCLERDRAERLDSMVAARLEIADALSRQAEATATAQHTPSRLRTIGVPLAAAVAGAALGAGLVWRLLQPPAPLPTSFVLKPPGGEPLGINVNQPDLAISPDGRRIVYGEALTATSTLTVRSLDGLGDIPLQGLGSLPRSPFFSPDGNWLGYFAMPDGAAGGHLMKLQTGGGVPVEIAALPGVLRGASWAANDTIIFGTSVTASGLFRISAAGGTPELLTTPDVKAGEIDHLWPCVMPDGKHVLFAIWRQAKSGGATTWDLAALDLATRTWRVIGPGSFPKYIPTGHLLYASEKGLSGVPFDPVTPKLLGDPVVLIDDVVFKPTSGAADVSISAAGTMAYVGGHAQDTSTLVWVDRQGQMSRIPSSARRYMRARLSPDGRRAAVVIDDSGTPAIWVYDFARETLTPLTPATLTSFYPVWSETGRDIFFLGVSGPESGVYRIPAAGTSAPELLMRSPPEAPRRTPTGIVPGSQSILVTSNVANAQQLDIQVLALDGTPALTPLIAGTGGEFDGNISPDGHWIAYSSTESGGAEVFLRPYPDVAADRIQVSAGGGSEPRWAALGRALFFQDASGSIWVVDVGGAGGRTVGKPVRLPDPGSERWTSTDAGFDVTPDGQRLLRIARQPTSERGRELRVVMNWFEVVRSKVGRAK